MSWGRRLWVFFGLVSSICTFLWAGPSSAQISHLELGAANINGVDSPQRFLVLDKTFEELVQNYGPAGTIYLNDLNVDGLVEAYRHALRWVAERGYTQIKIEIEPGDFRLVRFHKVKTAHLTNPDPRALPIGKKDIEIVRALERVAFLSETGLRISTYFYGRNFNLMGVLRKLVKHSKLINTGVEGLPYYFPEGTHYKNDPRTRDLGPPKIFELSPKDRSCPTALEMLFSTGPYKGRSLPVLPR